MLKKRGAPTCHRKLAGEKTRDWSRDENRGSSGGKKKKTGVLCTRVSKRLLSGSSQKNVGWKEKTILSGGPVDGKKNNIGGVRPDGKIGGGCPPCGDIYLKGVSTKESTRNESDPRLKKEGGS